MAARFDAALAGLKRAVMGEFGLPATLVAPDGTRHPVEIDPRREPVLVEGQGHAMVSSVQTVAALWLADWPAGVPLPTVAWTVEIAPDPDAAEDLAGRWDIIDPHRPGDGWLELYLSNRRPLT